MNKIDTLGALTGDDAKTTNNLIGDPAELRFTIDIKRAATGETETFELVGIINPTNKEQADVSNS